MNEPADPIRIAIIAPARSMRLGLCALLADQTEIKIIGEAASPEELGRLLPRAQVCLLAGRAAANPWPAFEEQAIPILLLLEERPRRLPVAGKHGPWGFLPLESSATEITAAAQALAAGLFVADPVWLAGAASPLMRIGEEDGPQEGLTPRETQVLEQLALGLANKQIAAVLGLSENTVKFHISSIYDKLGASNRAEAVRLGARRGLISL